MNPPQLYRELTPLRYVRRFSRFPLIQPINVIEHCYLTAMLGGGFAVQLETVGVVINRAQVVEFALWHDAGEAVTGDIPHDVKRHSDEFKSLADHAEEVALGNLLGKYGIDPRPDPNSLEACIVKVADCAELLCYTATERQLGNYALNIADQRIWALLDGLLYERLYAFRDDRLLDWFHDAMQQLREDTK